ncbi:ribosome maturation factor RimP [Firmicutes bacterium CAG:449]|nr:ribosome maturation factor RimP [Firmicutes bacterium CAG:449]
MTTLEEKIQDGIIDIVKNHNMEIDELHYIRRGKENVLEIYVERSDLSSIDLDEIVSLSEDISPRLDELDLISDNYCLDVSTSGADKPIKDFKKFPFLIGKYVQIKLINPIKGLNTYEGDLLEATDDKIVVGYKEKTRSLKVEIEIKNINKAKLTVKV